jgi:hypothetical protein
VVRGSGERDCIEPHGYLRAVIDETNMNFMNKMKKAASHRATSGLLNKVCRAESDRRISAALFIDQA